MTNGDAKWYKLYAESCQAASGAWPKAVINEKNKWPRVELFYSDVIHAGTTREMLLFADPSGITGKWALVFWTSRDKPELRKRLSDFFKGNILGLPGDIELEWQRKRDVSSAVGYIIKFRLPVRSWVKENGVKNAYRPTDVEIAKLKECVGNVIEILGKAGFDLRLYDCTKSTVV